MRFLPPSSRGRTLVSPFESQLLPPCSTTGQFAASRLCRILGMEVSLLTLLLLPLELCDPESALALGSDRGVVEAVNTTERWLTPSPSPDMHSLPSIPCVSQSHTVCCISQYQVWLLFLLKSFKGKIGLFLGAFYNLKNWKGKLTQKVIMVEVEYLWFAVQPLNSNMV